MRLTGHTRSSLHLAPSRNVCDGGKLSFSISLILLWLTVSFCFRHIVLSMQRSKDRQICGFEEYGDPPTYNPGRQRAQPSEFDTVQVRRFSEMKKNCVVSYKRKKAERKVYSYCAAPQCKGEHMHVTKERNCFDIFHSREYHSR